MEATQKRFGWLDPDLQAIADSGGRLPRGVPPQGDFAFRRGCTLLIDPVEKRVRYAISTQGDITDQEQLQRMRTYLRAGTASAGNAFYGRANRPDEDAEDLMHIHRGV